jgi:UDP-glucose 4-epimerase
VWIVTGASGFVGGHVLEAMGDKALGLTRQSAPRWDLPTLREALRGAVGVIHAASVVHRPQTPPEEYTRFNVGGTRALIEAARATGVRRLIFLSSIKVHGEAPPGIIDETTPLDAQAHYAGTKAEAETLVREAKDLAPIILRLCPVYGRGDKGNIRTMFRAIGRRRFFVPGDGSTRKSIVHVSTVVEIVKAAARQEEVTGTYVVADRHAPSIRELADCMARLLGRRRPQSIPRPVLRALAGFVERATRAAGIRTSISRELIDKATTASICDPSRVERALGVDCHVDLEASLADELSWLRQIGAN